MSTMQDASFVSARPYPITILLSHRKSRAKRLLGRGRMFAERGFTVIANSVAEQIVKDVIEVREDLLIRFEAGGNCPLDRYNVCRCRWRS